MVNRYLAVSSRYCDTIVAANCKQLSVDNFPWTVSGFLDGADVYFFGTQFPCGTQHGKMQHIIALVQLPLFFQILIQLLFLLFLELL